MQVTYRCDWCDFTGDDIKVSKHEEKCGNNPKYKRCGSCIHECAFMCMHPTSNLSGAYISTIDFSIFPCKDHQPKLVFHDAS